LEVELLVPLDAFDVAKGANKYDDEIEVMLTKYSILDE